MSLISLAKHLSKEGLSPFQEYSGIVYATDDPKQLGRCRVHIPGVTDDVSVNKLPWAANRLTPRWQGAARNSGSFSVPQPGSRVLVKFEGGSKYNPVMVSYHSTSDTVPTVATEDYPHTHLLWMFSTGTYTSYNVLRKVMRWIVNGTLNVESTQNIAVKCRDASFVGGNVELTAQNVTVTVESLTITASSSITLRCGSSTVALTPAGVTII